MPLYWFYFLSTINKELNFVFERGEELLSNKAETFQIRIPYPLRFLLNMQVNGSVSLDNKFGFHGICILS